MGRSPCWRQLSLRKRSSFALRPRETDEHRSGRSSLDGWGRGDGQEGPHQPVRHSSGREGSCKGLTRPALSRQLLRLDWSGDLQEVCVWHRPLRCAERSPPEHLWLTQQAFVASGMGGIYDKTLIRWGRRTAAPVSAAPPGAEPSAAAPTFKKPSGSSSGNLRVHRGPCTVFDPVNFPAAF